MEISFYKQWLNNGAKYRDGVAIYDVHGSNNVLKKLFASGESFYNKKKLDEELSKLTLTSSLVQVYTGFKSYAVPKKKIIVENLPEDLKCEYMELGPIIREISFLNSRLDVVATDVERSDLALRIVEIGQRRRGIYSRLDYFQFHGKKMDDLTKIVKSETATENDELKMLRLKDERKRLASQRSKALNKPNKQIKLNNIIARINEIDRELKSIV